MKYDLLIFICHLAAFCYLALTFSTHVALCPPPHEHGGKVLPAAIGISFDGCDWQ